MDIRSLSNIELKEQLLKHGVNPGPILPSTRSVYEKRLQQLLEKVKVQENGDDQYSDSDDEGAQFKDMAGLGNEVNCDGEDGAILKNYSRTNIPACIAAEFNQTIATLGDDFSVTKMLKQPEDATSGDLSELLSQSALGMSATRRKPIKGAAGRPIQFQYEDIVRRAKMKEQTKESQEEKRPQCFISVPLRITIFVLVAFVVLVLLTMESSPENPFEPPTEDTQLQQH
ncbi:LEM domain-containing protein 1 isoform X4 [Aquarana catesbeiana]|uniref:LEM domain-containing protein 1 isoform X4 n=1 Tax=Aquarana catesbeiana TaxID=8400 RepID=UPI003CC9DA6A